VLHIILFDVHLINTHICEDTNHTSTAVKKSEGYLWEYY
jgi:hypothetical protein